MGCNRELEYIEPEVGKWYYIYEDDFGFADPIDWYDQATAYGPFDSLKAAEEHFYHVQPHNGGSAITSHDDFVMDDTIMALIRDAVPANAGRR